MIKYLLSAILAITSLFAAAQDEIVITGTKKISKKLTPQQIIDSLNARFPNAKAISYYKVPADAAKKGWTINERDDLDAGDAIDLYTLKFKRDDFQYYGLYKPDGTLIMSKYEETVTRVPDTIRNSLKKLGGTYPGYKLLSRTYYKNTDHAKTKEYYEFVATNGKSKKKLYYEPDGKLVKVK